MSATQQQHAIIIDRSTNQQYGTYNNHPKAPNELHMQLVNRIQEMGPRPTTAGMQRLVVDTSTTY